MKNPAYRPDFFVSLMTNKDGTFLKRFHFGAANFIRWFIHADSIRVTRHKKSPEESELLNIFRKLSYASSIAL
jgi:hypothetical protein